MCENEYGNDDLIRSFEEFDEKLPVVAKVIVHRGIDFARLNDGNEDETAIETEASLRAFKSVISIFREMVECTSEMTADEFEFYLDVLLTGCEVVVMVNKGHVYEAEERKFLLTPEGNLYYQELVEECSD